MAQFAQVIKKNHDFAFLDIPANNLRNVDIVVSKNKSEKILFPTYLLEKVIETSHLSLKIASIDFYQDISEELREEINDLVESKNNKELANLIRKRDLDIRVLEFYLNSNYYRIYSNGLIWYDRNNELKPLLISIFR